MKQPEEIATYLKEQMDEGVIEFVPAEVGQPWISIEPGSLRKIAVFLRDDRELRFNTLMCLSGVHYPAEQELGVTYHLHSTTIGHTVALKVRVPIDKPMVPSVESVWKTADWHEREAYDMIGIVFEGHPNMTRILCPDDWEGHPLRKDYVQQDTYMGVTTRI
ncbi:MAG: NADH-quinone oxidoreductase subunit C [Cyclonatronaceae bacterium]